MQNHSNNQDFTREEKLYQLCFKHRIWTLSSWAILLALKEHEGVLNITGLTKITNTTMGAVSENVKRLAKHGLLSRATDPDNRRVRIVTLTETGEALAEKISNLFLEGELTSIRKWLSDQKLSFRGLVLATSLEKCQALTLGEVARRFGIEHGNTTLVVDDLTEVGYAIRTEQPDRRMKQVSLTREGESLVEDYLELVS